MRAYYKNKLINNSLVTYNELLSKPSINSVVLEGNRSSFDLNMYTIPQVDALIAASRAIRVVSALPVPTVPSTAYYVGPTSEGNYHVWLTTVDNDLVDMGMAIIPTYVDGDAISVEEIPGHNYSINVKYDDITITLNSEGELTTKEILAGDGIIITIDSEGKSIISVNYDNETITLDSEGRLQADSLPKPYIPETFLHISSEGNAEWVESKINGVELVGDLNTEEVKITWFGTDSEFEAITYKNPYTLYIINDSEGTVHTSIYTELKDKPSINGVELVEGLTSADLDMYTIEEINDVIASVKVIKRADTLPPKADRTPNCVYYVGTTLPYEVYLIDVNKNETYLGLSAVKGYTGVGPITISKDNEISITVDDETIKIIDTDDGQGGTVKAVTAMEMIGATSTDDGKAGVVPTPKAGDQDSFLRGDGHWVTPQVDYIVGEIKLWTGNVANLPTGWLLCDGRSLSRSAYSNLYSVIGLNYTRTDDGTGDIVDDGSTFKIPNLINKFPEGADSGDTALGKSLKPGLPDIEGQYNYTWRDTTATGPLQYSTPTGAFYNADLGTVAYGTSSAGTKTSQPRAIGFKASNYNSVYGNSTTVQPAAVTVNYIIRY